MPLSVRIPLQNFCWYLEESSQNLEDSEQEGKGATEGKSSELQDIYH